MLRLRNGARPASPEDLVAVRVADAGHEPAVAEHRLQLTGVAADAVPEDVQGQRRVVGVGTHLGPARDLVEPIVRHEVQLPEHLAVDVAQVHAAGEPEAQAGPGAHAFGRAGDPEPTGEHRVRGEHHGIGAVSREGKEQELPAPPRDPDGRALQRRDRLGRGSDEDGRWRRGFGDGPPGDASLELLGHHGQIGQLRHGSGSSLTAWYATQAVWQTTP